MTGLFILAAGVAFAAALALWLYLYKYRFWGKPIDYTQPRILFYHMINQWQPGQKFRGLRVSQPGFDSQLKWLQEDGWTFVTMADIARSEPNLPKRVAITFDDGYEDNFTAALPLLEKYDARATLYLVEDRHERDWSVSKKAHHNSGELRNEPKLTDEQVERLLQSGRFELGCHTRTHCNLSTTKNTEKIDEIKGSKNRLELHFGVSVGSFAYPFGIYSRDDVSHVRDAGFDTAVTTVEGIDTSPAALELKRIKVSGKDSLHVFKNKLLYGKQGFRKPQN